MDTFILNAIVQELRDRICPARINSILQPDEYVVFLVLWQRGTEHRLALSVDARAQYLCLTRAVPGPQGQLFSKFLSHHIRGGEIRAIRKSPLERVVTLEIVRKDIDGQDLVFHLILEIMGRYSNLILTTPENGKILESLRHVTAVQSSYRRIAPGANYVPPPPQAGKVELTAIDRDRFRRLLDLYEDALVTAPQLRFWKFLIQHVGGLSPLLAREIEGQSIDSSPQARWLRFSRIADALRDGCYQPTIVLEQETFRALSAVSLEQFSTDPALRVTSEASMNEAADRYYSTQRDQQRYASLQKVLLSPISAKLAKLYKKREHLVQQQAQIDNAEEYKRKGELLTANLYQLKRGMKQADVVNYYREDQALVAIPLDPRLTPSQNAQRYFKRYTKLKQGQAMTEKRFLATEQEISYLEELKFFIEDASTFQDLQRLQTELQEQGSARRKNGRSSKRDANEPAQPFLRLVSSDRFPIYVGKSSKENDLLTQRTALPEDIWLHVYQAPGSHVVILNRKRGAEVPERTLREAAALAAYYSKLRRSGAVDVMYTAKKYVRKPKGSPPGLVIVNRFQTLRVAPKASV